MTILHEDADRVGEFVACLAIAVLILLAVWIC